MRKLLMTVCSVLMLSIATFAQAQEQDTTSTDYNQQGNVEEAEDNATDDAGVREGMNSTEDQTREGALPTPEQTDQSTQEMDGQSTKELGESTPVDNKTGPNGEQVFMESGKYYYLNEAGEKVSIEESQLIDKTQ